MSWCPNKTNCYLIVTQNTTSNQLSFTIRPKFDISNRFHVLGQKLSGVCVNEQKTVERLHALAKLYILYQGSQQTCGPVTTTNRLLLLLHLHDEPEDGELQQVWAELAQQLRSARPSSGQPGEEGAEVHLQHPDLQVGGGQFSALSMTSSLYQ